VSESGIQTLLAALGEHSESVEIINPSTGKASFVLPQFSAAEVQAATAAARAAAPTWAATPVQQREEILLNLHDLMLKHQEEMLDLLRFETGKARGHAFEDFAGALNSARHYGKTAHKVLGLRRTRSGAPTIAKNFVELVPVGVVGVITPWNYPLALSGLDVFPALVAGNTVVHKIDNQTALTALFLRKLAMDAGLPSEVWTIVVGDGAEVGNAVTDSVDDVAFTGSTATGRIVAQRAAARLIGCSLELGGKNPMIILPGANIKKAAKLAVASAVGNTGQLCVSIERIYVPNDIKAEFTAQLAEVAASLTLGKSSSYDVDLGTLTGAAQLKRVTNLLADAVAKGAHLIGGQTQPQLGPNFISPAIVTDIPADATLNRGEVFGPVMQVYGYETVAQAIEAANDTDYGLNASVIGDPRQAMEVARQLNAGSVNINEGFRASFASMDSPMGGFKSSGQGRRNGTYGLTRFTEPKAIGIAGGFIQLPSRGHDYVRISKLLVLLTKVLRRLP
jgi:succinate-semialdehyde dehydrogenase/glutarate-semialdehyde dehydrogenase